MPPKRTSEKTRKTRETSVSVKLILDGNGEAKIDTGIGFLDHMLEQLAFHSFFDLEVKCDGDLHIDPHHSIEDIGLCLGESIKEALGNKFGIKRYGHVYIPMDEALLRVVIDCSGRPEFIFHGEFERYNIGALDTQMIPHFFKSLSTSAGLTLNMNIIEGCNDHHKAEGLFKAFALAIADAIKVDPRRTQVTSTKGSL